MKFIRDIIAEKKRHSASDEPESSDASVELNGAGAFESADALAKSIDEAMMRDEFTPDMPADGAGLHLKNGYETFENKGMTAAIEVEQPAEIEDDDDDLSSVDSFDLDIDEQEAREAETRRRMLLDALAHDDDEDEDKAEFTPDEPRDLSLRRTDDFEPAESPASFIDSEYDEEDAEMAEHEPEFDDSDSEDDAIAGFDAEDEEFQEEPSPAPQPGTADLTKVPLSEPTLDALPQAAPARETQDEAQVTEEPPVQDITPAAVETPVSIPKPMAGRAMGKPGRVKTRLLGFSGAGSAGADPFAAKAESAAPAQASFPVGWLVVVEGPGLGAAFTLFNGVSQIGRGSDQTIPLDFGDNSISRENHAAIAYDDEQKTFFLGHGGKTNLVRLNKRPVLSTEELTTNDQIRIGETVLRFVALCGEDFSWEKHDQDGVQHAACG